MRFGGHGGHHARKEHPVMENLHFQLHLWVKVRRMKGCVNSLIQEKHIALPETSSLKSRSVTINSRNKKKCMRERLLSGKGNRDLLGRKGVIW